MTRGELAAAYFHQGYNCSQAVFLAFCDKTGLDEKTAARLASSFGGGMGRLREVCGGVSGMLMAAGMIFGYDDPSDQNAKIEHYRAVQQLAAAFREKNRSIICRELLKDCPTTPGGVPQERNEAFYATRPCLGLIADAANILEDYLQQMDISQND